MSRPSSVEVPPSIVAQPGDHAQQRRLAAARRPDEDDELALLDFRSMPLMTRFAEDFSTPRVAGMTWTSPLFT
jgi:hypothetical protein